MLHPVKLLVLSAMESFSCLIGLLYSLELCFEGGRIEVLDTVLMGDLLRHLIALPVCELILHAFKMTE